MHNNKFKVNVGKSNGKAEAQRVIFFLHTMFCVGSIISMCCHLFAANAFYGTNIGHFADKILVIDSLLDFNSFVWHLLCIVMAGHKQFEKSGHRT